jgi:hypothetical protein
MSHSPKPETTEVQTAQAVDLPRIVRFLRDAIIVIACLTAILWLAKCPGNLEWWRPVCMGLLLPIIKRFL